MAHGIARDGLEACTVNAKAALSVAQRHGD
jgi:hypothetical protein